MTLHKMTPQQRRAEVRRILLLANVDEGREESTESFEHRVEFVARRWEVEESEKLTAATETVAAKMRDGLSAAEAVHATFIEVAGTPDDRSYIRDALVRYYLDDSTVFRHQWQAPAGVDVFEYVGDHFGMLTVRYTIDRRAFVQHHGTEQDSAQLDIEHGGTLWGAELFRKVGNRPEVEGL